MLPLQTLWRGLWTERTCRRRNWIHCELKREYMDIPSKRKGCYLWSQIIFALTNKQNWSFCLWHLQNRSVSVTQCAWYPWPLVHGLECIFCILTTDMCGKYEAAASHLAFFSQSSPQKRLRSCWRSVWRSSLCSTSGTSSSCSTKTCFPCWSFTTVLFSVLALCIIVLRLLAVTFEYGAFHNSRHRVSIFYSHWFM